MATTFEDAFKNYEAGSRGQTVAGMHNAQTQANLASLKSTYDQNLSDAQAARGNIDTAYRASANNLGAQYERQRRNNNIQAAANGLNTGTASQMQLAQANAYQRDYGNLMGQYGKDVAESERQMANLKAQYQNAVAQANAQGDYNRMSALMNDYNTQRNEQMQQAQILAQYGDFSGYGGMMNPDQVASMTSEYNRRRAVEDEDRAYSREQDAYQRAWNEDERAYNRAWNEEDRGYGRSLADAQTMASFGDFSGYEKLGYSKEVTNAMRELWIAQNPDLAYNTGAIDAERYRSMTGKYPAGYQAPSSGGGYYGGSKKKDTGKADETALLNGIPRITPATSASAAIVTPQVFYRGSGWGPASGAIRAVK